MSEAAREADYTPFEYTLFELIGIAHEAVEKQKAAVEEAEQALARLVYEVRNHRDIGPPIPYSRIEDTAMMREGEARRLVRKWM